MQQKEEGAPTLCNSMDGTGEHYAKQNKPGGEGQIPYDLTFNRNLINKDLWFLKVPHRFKFETKKS